MVKSDLSSGPLTSPCLLVSHLRLDFRVCDNLSLSETFINSSSTRRYLLSLWGVILHWLFTMEKECLPTLQQCVFLPSSLNERRFGKPISVLYVLFCSLRRLTVTEDLWNFVVYGKNVWFFFRFDCPGIWFQTNC